MSKLYVDSVAPVSLRITVTRDAGSTLDLTTVTAAVLQVRKPKLTIASDEAYVNTTWACTVVPGTASTCYLTHTFGIGDIDRVGDYIVAADLTVPAGTVPCDAVPVSVVARFA